MGISASEECIRERRKARRGDCVRPPRQRTFAGMEAEYQVVSRSIWIYFSHLICYYLDFFLAPFSSFPLNFLFVLCSPSVCLNVISSISTLSVATLKQGSANFLQSTQSHTVSVATTQLCCGSIEATIDDI